MMSDPTHSHADVEHQSSITQASQSAVVTRPEVLGLADRTAAEPVELFADFYAREFRNVVVLAYALCGSTGMAEDVAQEACMAAMRRWDSLDNPDAWIRRVVANKSVSTFRRRAVEVKGLLLLRSTAPIEAEVTPETGELWTLVRRLPKRQAQVLALRYIDGATASQIAEILEVSENTVKTHLKRAKQALAKAAAEQVTVDLNDRLPAGQPARAGEAAEGRQ